MPVVLVNPRQARPRKTVSHAQDVSASGGGAIDAAVLADFAAKVQPEVRPLPDEKARVLQELIARRRQLIQARVAEGNRLPHAVDRRVHDSITAMLGLIERQINDLDDQLQQMIEASPAWQAKADLLKTVPGVGEKTARQLVAQLPELGTCSRQQIAALVGVAPMNRDSGSMRGRRTTQGGRPHLRCALYMATLVATRHNPPIRAYHRRLVDSGKCKMVALVAAMRKLLTMLNAMLRDQQPWQIRTEVT